VGGWVIRVTQFFKKGYRLEIQSGKPKAESDLSSRLSTNRFPLLPMQTNVALLKY
jgi:hypothetical protein